MPPPNRTAHTDKTQKIPTTTYMHTTWRQFVWWRIAYGGELRTVANCVRWRIVYGGELCTVANCPPTVSLMFDNRRARNETRTTTIQISIKSQYDPSFDCSKTRPYSVFFNLQLLLQSSIANSNTNFNMILNLSFDCAKTHP